MSKPRRKDKVEPPFEEWDGSPEALHDRESQERRRPGPALSPSSLEIERLIEAAVRERRRGSRAWRPPVGPGDSDLPAAVLANVRTLDDLWSIWSLAPAPPEPGGRPEG